MTDLVKVTLAQYFGPWWRHPDHTPERNENAHVLLTACFNLAKEMEKDGVVFSVNSKTQSGVSGSLYGGFRPQSCREGAPKSSHKEGQGLDRYDPLGQIDAWLLAHPEALGRHGLYIEHPDKTPGWSHWTVRAPKSGNRIFYP